MMKCFFSVKKSTTDHFRVHCIVIFNTIQVNKLSRVARCAKGFEVSKIVSRQTVDRRNGSLHHLVWFSEYFLC